MLLPCVIILLLHLLSTNHKCTQPCYFPLLFKPAAQKVKMDWNSSTRSSRLRVAPFVIPVELWSLPLFRFAWVILVFRDIIYIIIVLYSWHLVICEHFLSVCVEQLTLDIHMMSTWFWHKNRVWHLTVALELSSSNWNLNRILFKTCMSSHVGPSSVTP
jgi:hypothetical protein